MNYKGDKGMAPDSPPLCLRAALGWPRQHPPERARNTLQALVFAAAAAAATDALCCRMGWCENQLCATHRPISNSGGANGWACTTLFLVLCFEVGWLFCAIRIKTEVDKYDDP